MKQGRPKRILRRLVSLPFILTRLVILTGWHGVTAPPRVLTYDELTNLMLLRIFGAQVSWKNVRIHAPLTLHNSQGSFRNLCIEDNCVINGNVYFDLRERITLKAGASIGPGVTIMTHNSFNSNPFLEKRLKRLTGSNPVTIGAGAGIKAHAVILHGVTVGADAVIAGGSIVSRDIPDRAYASGVPAVIRKIL